MNELIFEIVKVVLMAVVAGVTIYVIPYVKKKIGKENLDMMDRWAMNAVLWVEQMMNASTGEDKKAVVTKFLRQVRDENNLNITDDQIEVLIEAAVKAMNMNAVDISDSEKED